VSRAVDPARLREETRAYARRLADGPPIAMAFTKRGLQQALEVSLDDLLAFEAEAQAVCSKTADVQEGVRAFHERRPPTFRGV
jgi:2-(1,2-epoxy-1,2-dihydrophenyl)acetyl-CoA isomerase